MFPDLLRDDVFQLETPRLWLRWPRAADAESIAELAGDADLATMTANIPHPYPPGAAADFVLRMRAANSAGSGLTLAIARKNRPGELIGAISLTSVERPELGYWLGKPHWGHGYMTEAVGALLSLIFRITDIAVISSAARPDNPGSRRVLEKSGFASTGSSLVLAPARGGHFAVDRFELTREAYLIQNVSGVKLRQEASGMMQTA